MRDGDRGLVYEQERGVRYPAAVHSTEQAAYLDYPDRRRGYPAGIL